MKNVISQGTNAVIETPVNKCISSKVPEISYQYSDRLLLPKGPLPPDNSKVLNHSLRQRKRKRSKNAMKSIVIPLNNLIRCVCEDSQVSKLSAIFSYDCCDLNSILQQIECHAKQQKISNFEDTQKKILLTSIPDRQLGLHTDNSADINIEMLPSMPQLGTPNRNFSNETNINHDNTRPELQTSEEIIINDGQGATQYKESSLTSNFHFSSMEASCSGKQESVHEKVCFDLFVLFAIYIYIYNNY